MTHKRLALVRRLPWCGAAQGISALILALVIWLAFFAAIGLILWSIARFMGATWGTSP